MQASLCAVKTPHARLCAVKTPVVSVAQVDTSPQGSGPVDLALSLAQAGAFCPSGLLFPGRPRLRRRLPRTATRQLDWLQHSRKRGVVSVTKALMGGLLGLMMALLCPWPLAAAPVAVRFVEGVTRGFLLLRTIDGGLIASGDLIQVARGGQVESRMVFRFKDGSLFDETVVFTQRRVFVMQSYHLVQRGPAFAEDTEISLQRPSGKYHVKTKSHKDGKEEAIDGTLELPSDVYNGMVITAAKNLPKGAGATVHLVAFTPKPLLIELELSTSGRAQDDGRSSAQGRDPLFAQASSGALARALRQAAWPHAGGQPRLAPYGGSASVREIRGGAESDGAGLADRADQPAMARVARPLSGTTSGRWERVQN